MKIVTSRRVGLPHLLVLFNIPSDLTIFDVLTGETFKPTFQSIAFKASIALWMLFCTFGLEQPKKCKTPYEKQI